MPKEYNWCIETDFELIKIKDTKHNWCTETDFELAKMKDTRQSGILTSDEARHIMLADKMCLRLVKRLLLFYLYNVDKTER